MADGNGGEPVPVELGGRLGLAAAWDTAEGRRTVSIAPVAEQRIADAYARLGRIVDERRHVYGLTTGFGPLANRLVRTKDIHTLQQNLVHHLASGLGPCLGWAEARAVVLARLSAICRGVSGASPQAASMLLACLNSGLAPVLPARGTVGASGDLTPLAHMVLCFQGRGGFLKATGEVIEGPAGLAVMGRAPLDLTARDALALVNGTSAMTGIGIANAIRAERLMAWQATLSGALAECLGARSEAWHPLLAELRPHPGQIRATGALNAAVAGSGRLRNRPIAERILSGRTRSVEDEPGQDAYTLRCVPQVLGAAEDVLTFHAGIVETELCSVTDNPVLPEGYDPPALHGGNFMGAHVALAADAAATAITVVAGLAERQIARLTDEALNRGLPAFLHRGPAGLNSGFMGAQVTATALLAEMRATGPVSVHSISTNAANQDVVSMGTIAARLLAEKIDRLSELQAILALALAQAMDLQGGPRKGGFSRGAHRFHDTIRAIAPEMPVDRPLSGEIAATAECIRTRPPP